jgi:Zn-dependent protease/uncharacterized protein YndB with AHSA1/START domain
MDGWSFDPGILLILFFVALLAWRMPLVARAGLTVRAPPGKIFDIVDLQDGEEQDWHRAHVTVRLIDPETATYRIRYVVMQGTGTERVSHADFRVVDRVRPHRIVMERAGLEGQSHRNQLLKITADIVPANSGSRLTMAYHWGPRPLVAQFTARGDLLGGLYRIKGLAETGKPNLAADTVISSAIALVTGIVTLGGFAWWLGIEAAILIVAALFVHEFGHLLAFRLIGQPWGRMVFLPFLGALAVPRYSFANDGQHVFAALMGPAFGFLAAVPAFLALAQGEPPPHALASLAFVAALLNLFNLLPVPPLDGGLAVRAIARRLFGARGHIAMMVIGVALAVASLPLRNPIIIGLCLLAAVSNLRAPPFAASVAPLSWRGFILSVLAYAGLALAHGAVLVTFAPYR